MALVQEMRSENSGHGLGWPAQVFQMAKNDAVEMLTVIRV
jgi:hypothetical protein